MTKNNTTSSLPENPTLLLQFILFSLLLLTHCLPTVVYHRNNRSHKTLQYVCYSSSTYECSSIYTVHHYHNCVGVMYAWCGAYHIILDSLSFSQVVPRMLHMCVCSVGITSSWHCCLPHRKCSAFLPECRSQTSAHYSCERYHRRAHTP